MSLPFLVLMWAFIILAIGVESVHLYKLTPRLLANPKYKIDLWITRMLAVNGMGIYATWLSVAKFVQFTSVLQDNANVNSITAGAATHFGGAGLLCFGEHNPGSVHTIHLCSLPRSHMVSDQSPGSSLGTARPRHCSSYYPPYFYSHHYTDGSTCDPGDYLCVISTTSVHQEH